METIRMTLRLDKKLDKKVRSFAYKYNKSKNWMINMLVHLGLKNAKHLEENANNKGDK